MNFQAKKLSIEFPPGLHPADVRHVGGGELDRAARDPEAAAEDGQAADRDARLEGDRL